jgi:hypothetical protein
LALLHDHWFFFTLYSLSPQTLQRLACSSFCASRSAATYSKVSDELNINIWEEKKVIHPNIPSSWILYYDNATIVKSLVWHNCWLLKTSQYCHRACILLICLQVKVSLGQTSRELNAFWVINWYSNVRNTDAPQAVRRNIPEKFWRPEKALKFLAV